MGSRWKISKKAPVTNVVTLDRAGRIVSYQVAKLARDPRAHQSPDALAAAAKILCLYRGMNRGLCATLVPEICYRFNEVTPQIIYRRFEAVFY